jgi:hypothetical protein
MSAPDAFLAQDWALIIRMREYLGHIEDMDDEERAFMLGALTGALERHLSAGEAPPRSFTCPCCGVQSSHPADVRHGYCFRCHWWTGDPELGPPHLDGPCPERKVT